LHSVRGLRGMHRGDQLGETLLVALLGTALAVGSDPGEVVAAVGGQCPAEPLDTGPSPVCG